MVADVAHHAPSREPERAPSLERPDAQRATISLFVEAMALGRPLGDPLDRMILAVILQANNAPIAAQADLQLRYATLAEPAPDALRRPITIHAVAVSLGLSFESVRRRVHGLVERGACVLSPAGLTVPAEVVASPPFQAAAGEAYTRLQACYAALKRLGVLDDLPASTAWIEDDVAPVRAALRIGLAYLLRVSDAARAGFGDVVTCLILFEIVRWNTEHLDAEEGVGLEPGMLSDSHRRPVTIAGLARRLGFAAETTRRHVLALTEAGVLQRVRGGLIVPAHQLASPAVARFCLDNLRDARRMFAALSTLGVLDVWRRAGVGA
ncbi:hypothetical protein ACO2Q0_11180 [Phenylobacterium sp. VNQ135]|uniref:hypothetical protein n=1 Tax=Phenylobacterium sp. VNQ135 TaxID=3400922 RepID=UPI003C071341